jgi:hypothetical protein
MTKYRTHGQSQFLLSPEIIPRPDNPNRNKPQSNPVTGQLMLPDQVTEGECRVITHPRPKAAFEINVFGPFSPENAKIEECLLGSDSSGT